MSLALGIPLLECVYLLGCARWAWRRCLYTGGLDSENWSRAELEDFEPIPRMCRYILAVYERDLAHPEWAPPGGYRMEPANVRKRAGYSDTQGNAPPYLLYLDHEHRDIVLAVRGLNLGKESDYAMLLDNSLGKQMFDGGYVHSGLLKAAGWLLNQESETLKGLVREYPGYTLSLAGHSLGAGVASLATMLIASNKEQLGKVSIRCYALAPPRCMSLNLAVKHANIINSVILQDDFLPRTATPLEDIFSSIFCLPCLLCFRCCRDTCIPEERLLKDPRRLYAPGRMYHVVERKFCRCGIEDPVVKCDIPVKGRFEHVVLSCNATADHSIICIEREAQKALELMEDEERAKEMPTPQKMDRKKSIVDDHRKSYKVALETAVFLEVPYAFSPSYGTFESDKSETDGCEAYITLGHGEGSSDSLQDLKTETAGIIDTDSVKCGIDDSNVRIHTHGSAEDVSSNDQDKGLAIEVDNPRILQADATKTSGRFNWDEVINRLFASKSSMPQ